MSAPAVAVAQDGSQMVFAWKDIRTREPNVYWSIFRGQRSDPERLLHSSVRGPQDHPALAVAAGGVVWAAWEDGRDGKARIRARSSASPAEHLVSEPNDGICGYPSIAVANGLVAVAYESERNGTDCVLVRMLGGRR